MATLTLDPHSEYKTRGPTENGYTNAQGNALKSWGSAWDNYTSQDSRNDDANAFYFGQMHWASPNIPGIYDWSCRLSFTLPDNFYAIKINKLIVKLKAQDDSYKIKYPIVILSAANHGPNPQLIMDDTSAHISTSEFYKNINKSATYNDQTTAAAEIYFIFDSFTTELNAGTTYYIYFIPYYRSERETLDFDDMNFQGRNLEGYITITLDYEDTNWHQASIGLYANNKWNIIT